MTPWESLLQSNNESSMIKQMALIAFFILEYIYIYIYVCMYMSYIEEQRILSARWTLRNVPFQYILPSDFQKFNNISIQTSKGTLQEIRIKICKYNIYIFVYTNLPVNAIVRLPHPRSGDSQGQKEFLAPFSDKQTHNYGTECSNHHPYQH